MSCQELWGHNADYDFDNPRGIGYSHPMSDIFKGIIRDVTSKGLGVVNHPDGRIFFVTGGWPGDQGLFIPESSQYRYGTARLKELESPSPDRVKPRCPHHGYTIGACGGCPWMIGAYNTQLQLKQNIIAHTLKRAGFSLSDTRLQFIIGADDCWGYRNRAQLKTNGEEIGFVSTASHVLAPIQDCLVLSDKNRCILQNLRSRLPNPDWRPQNGHAWNFIDIDEAMDLHRIVLNKRRFFQQANSVQNEKIKAWLGEKLHEHSIAESVLELFAGSGNLTQTIAQCGFSQIFAVDVIVALVKMISTMELPGVRALEVDLYDQCSFKKLRDCVNDPKILILDPPRSGFRFFPRFLGFFPKINTIYYISCHVGAFVRDACALRRQKWTLQEVQPLDVFPHTPHMELLSRFTRN